MQEEKRQRNIPIFWDRILSIFTGSKVWNKGERTHWKHLLLIYLINPGRKTTCVCCIKYVCAGAGGVHVHIWENQVVSCWVTIEGADSQAAFYHLKPHLEAWSASDGPLFPCSSGWEQKREVDRATDMCRSSFHTFFFHNIMNWTVATTQTRKTSATFNEDALVSTREGHAPSPSGPSTS